MFLVLFLLFSTNVFAQDTVKTGMWRGVLQLNDSTGLPFNFEIKKNKASFLMEIINAEERIIADEIVCKNDSVFIKMPVFDSEFRLKILNNTLEGTWVNHARKDKYAIPFKAVHNERRRFFITGETQPDKKEKWKVIFNAGTDGEYLSVGTFVSENGSATGTFATETGDYGYLEGVYTNKKFMVSNFDGAHAFLFTAEIKKDSLVNGHFYSGRHGHEKWVAVADNHFELRDPEKLTYLKPGYSKIDFNFKNLEGKSVSLNDEKFRQKVVIIQLMGSWCPNCIDETKFLAAFYDVYQKKGLEIIGLAFERAPEFNKAVANINRLKTRFGAGYEFLITGKTGAGQAAAALPMLNTVMAFPTTIIIDKKGAVRKIYTGFYGPATGNKYTEYVEQTTLFIEKLLQEH